MKVSIEKPGTPEELVHFGVKGMKWGVRKQKGTKPPLTGLIKKPITSKTKSGEEFTLSPYPPNIIHKGLSRISKRYRKGYETSSFLDIKDKTGKSIGNFSIKKDDDELNLIWIDVKKSARGHGYATAVTKETVKWAKENGIKKVTLEAVGNSPGDSAVRLAKQMGFKVTKEPTAAERKADLMWNGLTEMELAL